MGQQGFRTGGSGVLRVSGRVCSGQAAERVVLALGLERAGCGTRSSGANGQQNERLWGAQAEERVALGQPDSTTRGYGAAGALEQRMWVSGRACMQRMGSRTGGSGIGTDTSDVWNENFCGERAAERVVMGQSGSRTSGSGTAGLQNERLWGSWALERAVLAGCGLQDGRVCSGQAHRTGGSDIANGTSVL